MFFTNKHAILDSKFWTAPCFKSKSLRKALGNDCPSAGCEDWLDSPRLAFRNGLCDSLHKREIVQPSVNFTYPMASVSTSINIAYRVISDLTACVSILCISHPVAGTQPVRNKCARANAVCERSVDIKKCNSRHSSLFIYWFSPNLQPVTKPIAYQKAHISEKKGR